jgi:hypothetical protein
VLRGFTQREGIDFDETFSPVVKPATIRTVLSLALSSDWPIHQLDVKNAFLNGTLTETVYARQPSGFTDPKFPDKVCRLNKSLYGLKQAPQAWFQRFASFIASVGFIGSKSDSSLFVYRRGADMAYLLLYVDDIILTASFSALLHGLIASLHTEFSMTDMGDLQYFLGISVTRSKDSCSFRRRSMHWNFLTELVCYSANPSLLQLILLPNFQPSLVILLQTRPSIAALQAVFSTSRLLDQTSLMPCSRFVSICMILGLIICFLSSVFFATSAAPHTMVSPCFDAAHTS